MAERLTGRPHILYVVEKPCNIYKLYRNPYDNYMISLQSVITCTTYKIWRLPVRVLQSFSLNIAEKTMYPCKCL